MSERLMHCGNCEFGNHDVDTCEAASASGIVPMREKHWRDNEALALEGIAEMNAADLRSVAITGNGRVVNPNTPLDPVRVTVGEAAVLQSFPSARPASTLVGTRRSEGGLLVGRQLANNGRRDVGGHQTAIGLAKGMLPGPRVSTEEGAALQSIPGAFVWDAEYVDDKGRTRKVANTKKYLIIGNAEPPLLAQRVLEALWSTEGPRIV